MAELSCKRLEELKKDEHQAWKEYKKLSETTEHKELFSKLAGDEKRHQIALTLLHSQLCWNERK